MKTKLAILCLLTTALCPLARAQGTAFTYQGRLNDGAGPASGTYDLRFTVYTAGSGGSALVGPVTNTAIAVSNGLFTATLDFGTGVFTGADRWLEIGVRSNGAGSFTALAPRQALTPTPYAIYAKGASASGITGTLPAASLFGTYTSPLTFNNGANSFSGSFYGQFFGTSFTGGSFSGDGSGLLNLNASQITEGDFPASSLENAWRIIGNSGTSATNWIGTTENHALDFRVNNLRGFRIEPDPRPGNTSANIIGGSPSNLIELPGSGGSAIVGGGFPGGGNVIRSNSSGVFIGAGSVNEAGPNANDVVIAGGFANIARTSGAVIGGGGYNLIQANSDNAMIGGGYLNSIQSGSGFSAIAGGAQNSIQTNSGFSAIGGGSANILQTNSPYSTIGGGADNEIQGNAPFSTISGGWLNRIHITADQSAIAGGNANQIYPGARESFIGGGFANLIYSNAYNAVIGGGAQNFVNNAGVATIGGGVGNTNTGYAATVAGGFFNTAANNGAAVGGGGQNSALGFNSVVSGGNNNLTTAEDSAIGGGHQNTNTGLAATIGGGYWNQATTFYATVPGGYLNLASGFYSQAAGRQAKAIHNGAFVWADSTAADFPSTVNNEFAVRASGGVRFLTSGAGFSLNGQQVLTANSTLALTLTNSANSFVGTFNGDGTGLTNLNAWRLGGNAGTIAGINFVGTTDNQPLDIRVNNVRALRIEPNTNGAPNVIGGAPINFVGPGIYGATIGGGGSTNSGGFVRSNSVFASFATISGGWENRIAPDAVASTISGGYSHDIGTNTFYALIGGGADNRILGNSYYGTIGGGGRNDIGANSVGSTIAGGEANAIEDNSPYAVIAGGSSNDIGTNSSYAVVGGGFDNNVLSNAAFATIPGGSQNSVAGTYALAAGRRAKANHNGSFVWADNTAADFASTAPNQFLVRASGGVGIGTTNPVSPLHVAGDARVEGLIQLGSGTGTTQPPDRAILTRRVISTQSTIGNVVARTDRLTLERDGTSGGWRIVNQANPGNTTIAATGLTGTGTTVNSVLFIPGGAAIGTNVVFTDAQNVVSFRCSFGDSYGPIHMTEVSLTRYNGDLYWTGTGTSTFNQ